MKCCKWNYQKEHKKLTIVSSHFSILYFFNAWMTTTFISNKARRLPMQDLLPIPKGINALAGLSALFSGRNLKKCVISYVLHSHSGWLAGICGYVNNMSKNRHEYRGFGINHWPFHINVHQTINKKFVLELGVFPLTYQGWIPVDLARIQDPYESPMDSQWLPFLSLSGCLALLCL